MRVALVRILCAYPCSLRHQEIRRDLAPKRGRNLSLFLFFTRRDDLCDIGEVDGLSNFNFNRSRSTIGHWTYSDGIIEYDMMARQEKTDPGGGCGKSVNHFRKFCR